MKKILLTGAILSVIVLALGAAGLAFAQGRTPTPPGTGYGPGMMGGSRGGYGMMGGAGSYGPMHTYMVAAFAEALGLEASEVQTRLAAGDTMWDIAAEQGLSAEEISAVMIAARQAALEQAVADGAITQEQAEWMAQHMAQRQGTGFGPGACHGQGGGPGGRGPGWRWQNP